MPEIDYDVIVLGGGHNGLVAAAYLARAEFQVLNLRLPSWRASTVLTPCIGTMNLDWLVAADVSRLKLLQRRMIRITSAATRFMESLLGPAPVHWDDEPTPQPLPGGERGWVGSWRGEHRSPSNGVSNRVESRRTCTVRLEAIAGSRQPHAGWRPVRPGTLRPGPVLLSRRFAVPDHSTIPVRRG